jgi:hypothetical protein
VPELVAIQVGGLRQERFWVSGGFGVVDGVRRIRTIEREGAVKATADVIRGRQEGLYFLLTQEGDVAALG